MLVEGVMPIKPGRRNDRCMISIDRALLQVYRPESSLVPMADMQALPIHPEP
jgi:hypothetical protein